VKFTVQILEQNRIYQFVVFVDVTVFCTNNNTKSLRQWSIFLHEKLIEKPTSQDICRVLRNAKVHCLVYQNLPLDRVLKIQ
jgi:hypothetical protein